MTRFQPIYVNDVAQAAVNVLDNPQSDGKIYSIGGPEIFTFKELMEKMLYNIGKKRLWSLFHFLQQKSKLSFYNYFQTLF